MTDLEDEIAYKFIGYDPEYEDPKEIAQAIKDLIISRIPPPVWEKYCVSGSSSAKTVFGTEYVAESKLAKAKYRLHNISLNSSDAWAADEARAALAELKGGEPGS